MACKSNCNTCEYKQLGKNTWEAGQHCYMFRTAPDGVCGQHKMQGFGAFTKDINRVMDNARRMGLLKD